MSQVDIVCKLLTMSHVQAGHGRVSMGGLVLDTEDEGDEDVAGSQVMGSQGGGKGRTKRAASHKSKVQHILVLVVLNPDMRTYRRLLHRRQESTRRKSGMKSSFLVHMVPSIVMRCCTGGFVSRPSRQGGTGRNSGE